MTGLLVILVVLALIFGVGSVIEGVAWALLIGALLFVAAAWLGWRKFQNFRRSQ